MDRLQKQRQSGLKHGWRSGLEEQVGEQLSVANIPYEFETLTLEYRVEETRKYTPDFILLDNGIIVETKGRWITADRKKMRLVKLAHPDLDIRMVFSNPNSRISKSSRTSYAKWASDHGFPYAKQFIPTAWLQAPPNWASLAAIERLRKS